MLKLIGWLDIRHIVGALDALAYRCVAVAMLGFIGWQISAARDDGATLATYADAQSQNEMPDGTTRPIIQPVAYADTESLFRAPVTTRRQAENQRAEKRCLAQAIYYEARSEPLSGWKAVADVVINRVNDRRYPSTVCGVVFQGEYRRHKCQFSFACDGKSDRPKNRILWQRSQRVAAYMLMKRHTKPTSLPATHYHADYVDPYWNRDMLRLAKIGRHIFYNDLAQTN